MRSQSIRRYPAGPVNLFDAKEERFANELADMAARLADELNQAADDAIHLFFD